MIIAAIKIKSTELGIVVEQVVLSNQSEALPEERAMAGVLDIALKSAMEFIGVNSGKGTMIEGKDIEEHINSFLKEHHTRSFQSQLKELGIKLPPQG
jgi:hypothetical protein